MASAPDEVKELINFDIFVQAMRRARTKAVPKQPASMVEAMEKFERNEYPPRFQEFYRGSVSITKRGNERKSRLL